MSEERDKLNKAFNRSRSRLAYVNIGLAVVLVLAAVIQICIMLMSY
jgi:type IV secretory pathway component VirB8